MNDSKLIIIHQNIRSMRANFDCFLAEISTWKQYPDVIILSEIWINSEEIVLYNIPGYELIVQTNDSHRSGGVAIFVKRNISMVVCNESTNFNYADVVKTKFNFMNIEFYLLAVYRLLQFNTKLFTNELNEFLQKQFGKKQFKNLLIIGDCNIDLLNCESNEVDSYKVMMASQGMEALINCPTRVTKVSQTCIDHVFVRSVNKHEFDFKAEVLQTQITDHYATLLTVRRVSGGDGRGDGRSADRSASPPPSPTSTRLCTDTLLALLNTVDWSIVKTQIDASLAYDIFETQLLTCIAASTFEEKKSNMNKKKLKPWITNSICNRIERRNNLFRKVKQRPLEDNFRKYYVKYRNKLNREIKLAKTLYYSNEFQRNAGNAKAIWNTVNEITGQRKRSNNFTLNINGKDIDDKETIANEFNKYFITVVNEVVGDYLIDDNLSRMTQRNVFPDNQEQRSIFLSPVLKEEVEKIIMSLKNGKSPGIDGINSTLLKKILPAISDVLTVVVNLSFSTGVFPEKLKKAVVIPIYKKGPPNNCTNYRPISLISTFSKVFEKLMKERMLAFLDKNNFFSNNQYGFRKGLSTELALHNFMNKINTGINDGKYVRGLFIDIKKAFDTVNHTILLNKLYKCGFRGVARNWFESYLSRRQQCVRINGILSQTGDIYCGVPQGSVLGATLFIIFINDLCDGKFKGHLTAFADDTALSYVETSLNTVYNHMKTDVDSLNWWFLNNRLVLSTEKTTYINFSLRHEINFQQEMLYKCSDCLKNNTECTECSKIQSSPRIKYLGVILDRELTWKNHLEQLKRKTISCIRLFYFLKNICPLNTLRLLYFALVNSKLEYGIICWGGTYLSNIKPLYTLQKCFMRLILNKDRYYPSFQCFSKLKILPLRSLYIYKVLKLFVSNGKFLNDYNVYRIKLRSANNYVVPKPNLTYYTKTFSFIAPRVFNQLDDKIKLETNCFKFLKLLKEWLLSKEDVDYFLRIEV